MTSKGVLRESYMQDDEYVPVSPPHRSSYGAKHWEKGTKDRSSAQSR